MGLEIRKVAGFGEGEGMVVVRRHEVDFWDSNNNLHLDLSSGSMILTLK